jgi:hypothetical protein
MEKDQEIRARALEIAALMLSPLKTVPETGGIKEIAPEHVKLAHLLGNVIKG